MVEDLSREEVIEGVDRVVKDLLLAADVVGPPVDVVALARRHLALPDAPRRRPGHRRRPESFAAATPEEQQWEAALRVGDHLKPELLRRLGLDPAQPRGLTGESLSRLVAEHLLLPTSWFGRDAAAAGFDVAALKETYRTAGHELIAWRLLDLDEPCVITVVDDDRVRRRRSNAWQVRKELSPAERRCQQDVSRSGEPRVVRAGGWTVQGWPVPSPFGKREVLRGVVEDAEQWPDPGGA